MNRERGRRKKPIDKRAILFAECGGKCPICGREMSLNNPRALNSYMTIDHIIPKSQGGRNTLDNYMAMCRKCNMKKADSKATKYQLEYKEEHNLERWRVNEL